MENRLGLPNVVVAQCKLEGFSTIPIFLSQAFEGNFGSAEQIPLTRDTLQGERILRNVLVFEDI